EEERVDEALARGRGLRLAGEQPLGEDLVRRAEEDAHCEARIEVLPELAALHPLADDGLEEPEVLDELRAREALDEPGAPPQLDLEDRRQVSVGGEVRDVDVEDVAEARARGRLRLEETASDREELLHLLVEDDPEEVLLVLEIEVDGALGDAGGRGDLRDAR